MIYKLTIRHSQRWILVLLVSLQLFSCDKQQKPGTQQGAAANIGVTGQSGSWSEDFEQASKNGYASSEETFSSGTWLLNDALIGSEQNDKKKGNKALRIRNNGFARMNFDIQGVQKISVQHAVYGNDKSVTWELKMSNDGGKSWHIVGKPVQTTASALHTATFSISGKKNARFAFHKTDGTPNRLNLDNVTVGAQDEAIAHNNPAPQPATPSGNTPPPSSGADVSHPPAQTNNSPHLQMGAPADGDPSDDYLLVKKQYALSYNPQKHVPNWVSSQLTASHFGPVPRFQGKFMPDMDLPEKLYRVRHDDYTGSGFDRGHMVRSEERTATPQDNESTFLTTNLLPQTHDLNAGPWLRLEEECQRLAQRENKDLYIICGGIYNKNFPTIGKGKVAVPEFCFKAVLVLNRGQGLKDVTGNTRVIAVIMPNVTGISHNGWQQYTTTVDDIERKTGYDLFNALPTAVQQQLESKKGQ